MFNKFHNVVSLKYVYNILRIGTMEWRRWKTMDLSNLYFGGFMLYDFRSELKAFESSRYINIAFDGDTSLIAQYRTGSLAFALPTTTSKICHANVAHLSSIMSACTRWLGTSHNRKHVSFLNLFWYHNKPWWITWVLLSMSPSFRSRYPTAGCGTAPASCWRSCFAAKVQVYQNLSQLHCHWRCRVGSVRQWLVQTVVVPTGRTPEKDTQAWTTSEMWSYWLYDVISRACCCFKFLHITLAQLCSCTAKCWIARQVRFNPTAQTRSSSASFTRTPYSPLQTSHVRCCLSSGGKCPSIHRTRLTLPPRPSSISVP